MIVLMFAVVSLMGPDVPKTFEELELAEIMAVHQIKAYRSEAELNVIGDDGVNNTLRWNSLLDRGRFHVTLNPSTGKVEYICNSTKSWAVLDQEKEVGESTAPTPAFSPKSEVFRSHDGFKFQLCSDQSAAIRFAMDPPFRLQSVSTDQVGSQTLRKAVATVISKRGNKATLIQWFLPDKWILVKATMDVHIGNRDQKIMDLKVSEMDFNVKISNEDFKLNPNRVVGYQKIDKEIAFNLDTGDRPKTAAAHLGMGIALPSDVTTSESSLGQGDTKLSADTELNYSNARKCGVLLLHAQRSDLARTNSPAEIDLADSIFRDITPMQGDFQSMKYHTVAGWPTLDADVKPRPKEKFALGGSASQNFTDPGIIHFRIYRVKDEIYEAILFGPSNEEERTKVLDSLALPKKLGPGA
jgi:hypothetical protein